ncbi:3-dehydroquinate synthase [Olsenella urininfantis]|uniref:3-dehydroquinate synthase n=1 Tax=Olsenella urininfantis TaxID=1871033 RepID=UPI001F3952F6|nr:3-dehydroquinate synthase [Olsenella urininfantis]
MSEEELSAKPGELAGQSVRQEPTAAVVPSVQRQWVSIPGGSCDVRLGHGVMGQAAAILRTAVGRPQACALLVGEGSDEGQVELMRRELTSAGFLVDRIDLPGQAPARQLSCQVMLLERLDGARITSDDLVVAMGDVDMLCAAVSACASWCGGVALACVPRDLDAMLEVAPTPRGIDLASHGEMLTAKACCRYLLCDLDHMELSVGAEPTRLALALMVSTAMAESEQAFSRLWDRSIQIAEGDEDALAEQALDTLKSRGHIVSSTALAVRQSISYGSELARALARLVDESPSTLLAEGLRFSARISAGEGKLPVDDVFAQDDLLERLGLPALRSAPAAEDVVRELKEERFLRTRRFLLALPQVLGRVRLSSVDDDLLLEHVQAWCGSRESA